MDSTTAIVQIVLGLLVAVGALVTIARRIEIPYPILLVVGGLILGLVPGLPSIELKPEIVLLLFLPPLLYWESLNTSFRDFRADLRAILLLSIGLVLATTCVVAVVAHMFIGLSWPTAFVLGAIISPTDTVAAAAIAQRLRLPRRIVTVLGGESLVNDATALVLYVTAVDTVTGGSFSFLNAVVRFLGANIGGVLLGLAVGWCIVQIRRYLHDPPVENTLSLLSGFAAYLPATTLQASGVLAVLTMGLYLGRRGPSIVSSQTCLQAVQVWEIVVFLLNGLIFILIGLQLHSILTTLTRRSITTLILQAALVSLTVILVRIIWVFPGAYLPRFVSRWVRERDPYPSWKAVVVVGWTGMRGGVSLAAALALPLVANTKTNAPFPDRDIIIFLTFSVILATLVVQGLSLPPLIRLLKLPGDTSEEHEEAKARLKAARAAMARLDELSSEEWIYPDIIEDLRSHFSDQDRRFTARFHNTEDGDDQERRAESYQRLKIELIGAERRTIIDLRNRGIINDDVMRRIQRDLDLEEVRLQP